MNRKTMVSFKTNMRHQNLKRVRKGMLAPLVVVVFVRDVSRIGQRGSGVGDGPPLSPQRTPPSASASVALEHHGYSSSYLVRSHDALELSFRSERSQLPGLALWLPAPPPAQPETPEILPPRPKTYLGNVEPQTHFAPPVGNKGVFYRGETGRQMSVHIRCVFRV